MIFQKQPVQTARPAPAPVAPPEMPVREVRRDDVETVVGPSVNVEGDFASEGNIIVKGSVTGSVHTSKHLSVEEGARIMANVRAGSVKVAGEVRGNMKIQDTLEITSTGRVLGDVEAKTLVVEGGALIFGKVAMPGIDGTESKARVTRTTRRAPLDESAVNGG